MQERHLANPLKILSKNPLLLRPPYSDHLSEFLDGGVGALFSMRLARYPRLAILSSSSGDRRLLACTGGSGAAALLDAGLLPREPPRLDRLCAAAPSLASLGNRASSAAMLSSEPPARGTAAGTGAGTGMAAATATSARMSWGMFMTCMFEWKGNRETEMRKMKTNEQNRKKKTAGTNEAKTRGSARPAGGKLG